MKKLLALAIVALILSGCVASTDTTLPPETPTSVPEMYHAPSEPEAAEAIAEDTTPTLEKCHELANYQEISEGFGNLATLGGLTGSTVSDEDQKKLDGGSIALALLGSTGCYQEFAVYSKDISVCSYIQQLENLMYEHSEPAEQLKTADGKNAFSELCISAVASATGDASACNSLTLRDECLKGVAIEKVDLALCGEISTEKDKNICIVGVVGDSPDETICTQLETEKAIDSCYIQFAQKLKDVSVCDQITETEAVSLCYLQVATITKDKSVCEKLTDQSGKTMCMLQFTTDPLELMKLMGVDAGEIEKPQAAGEQALAEIAIVETYLETNDLTGCLAASDTDLCYSAFAEKFNKPALCTKISNASLKASCEQAIGNKKTIYE